MLNSPSEEMNEMMRQVDKRTKSSLTLALSDPSKMVGITKHIIQGNLCDTRKFVFPNLTVDYSSPSRVQTTNDGTFKTDSVRRRVKTTDICNLL
jgi:hypothetical protein